MSKTRSRSGDGQLSLGSHRAQNPVELWGLTGGVAAGKSLVARFFAELGIPVIDADQIVRDLSAPGGEAYEAIQKRFGTADRAKLRQVVFEDEFARRDLEAILHPLVQAETLRRTKALSEAQPGKRLRIIYEAALLVETGRYRTLNGLIVVDAPRELRKQRLIARDGHSPELAEKILASQIADPIRIAAATAVIENSGTEESLREKVRQFARERQWI